MLSILISPLVFKELLATRPELEKIGVLSYLRFFLKLQYGFQSSVTLLNFSKDQDFKTGKIR